MSLLRFSWCDQCCEVMSLLNTLIQFTPWQLLSLLLFSRESCVQLFCDPMYCSLPGSSVHGISQVRILTELPCLPQGILRNLCRDRIGASYLADGFFTTDPPWKPVIILTCSQIVPSLARGSFLGWALSSFNKNRRVLLAPLMSGRTPCCRLILRFPVRISCFFKKPWFLLVSSGISRSQQK